MFPWFCIVANWKNIRKLNKKNDTSYETNHLDVHSTLLSSPHELHEKGRVLRRSAEKHNELCKIGTLKLFFFSRIAALSLSPAKPLTSWTAPSVDDAVKWKKILQYILTIPNSVSPIPFSYLGSEHKCLWRSVSSAVWDGIRPDFSIYPPPAPSSTSLPLHPPTAPPPLLISCSHFMMTGNPAGLEGRHLSSHSQEGIFWVKCGDYDLNAPQRSCDPSPA